MTYYRLRFEVDNLRPLITHFDFIMLPQYDRYFYSRVPIVNAGPKFEGIHLESNLSKIVTLPYD